MTLSKAGGFSAPAFFYLIALISLISSAIMPQFFENKRTLHKEKKMSVHGVDFLIDFYALFDVPRDASTTSIKKAYQEKIKGYHPDILARAAPEFRERAKERARIFNEGWKILSKTKSRAEYDQQLISWNGPISRDGTPVVDLTRYQYQDDESLEHVLGMVATMSGFDPDAFELLEEQFNATDNPSEKLRRAYTKALEQKDLYLSLSESFRANSVGIETSNDGNPSIKYLADAQQRIEKGRERYNQDIEVGIQMITAGSVPMLPAGVENFEEVAQNDSERAIAIYREQAEQRFAQRSEEILQIATERQAVIEKRIELSTASYLHHEGVYTDKVLLGMKGKEGQAWFAFYVVESNITIDPRIDTGSLGDLTDRNQAQSILDLGYNIAIFEMQDGVPLWDQTMELVFKHFDLYLNQQGQALERGDTTVGEGEPEKSDQTD